MLGIPVVGRIANWNGTPAVGLHVRERDDSGESETVTDADGRFDFIIQDALQDVTVIGIDTVRLRWWNRPAGGYSVGVAFDIHLRRPLPPTQGSL